MNASIGVRTQDASALGSGGGTSGSVDHHLAPSKRLSASLTSSGQEAPSAIQLRNASISAAERGSPFLGINGSSPVTYSIRTLASASPAVTASPLSPPVRRPAAVVRSS